MAAPLAVVSSMAARHVLADLAAGWGDVELRPMGGVDAARLARAGEPFDVLVLAADVMARLEAEGCILPGSCVGVARSGMAVAVPAGADVPAVGTEDAVKRAMLAGRVAYSTGPSGDHLLRLWARWGIAGQVTAVQAPPGVPVAVLLARGAADLGVQQLPELLGQPGITVAGPLPGATQALTVFTAGIGAGSAQVEAARSFTAHLAAPAAEEAKRRRGMEGVPDR